MPDTNTPATVALIGSLSVAEVAQHLGLSPVRVRQLAQSGRITATHSSPGNRRRGEWLITPEAVAAYQQHAENPRAPAKGPRPAMRWRKAKQ